MITKVGIQGPPGASGMVNRGTYIAETAYIVRDVVQYQGSSYYCKTNSTGHLPTDETYWNLLVSKGDQGNPGASIAFATKAAMEADLAHVVGIWAWVTSDTTTANNGFYRKEGASGTGGWVGPYDMPVPDGSITEKKVVPKAINISKLSDEVYKSIVGFKASYKAASGLNAYVKFTFDADGLGLLASQLMRGAFETYISDTNLTACSIKTYLSNSPTVISGGVNFSSPSQPLTYDQFNSYAKDVTYYNTSYRYIHVLVQFTMTANVLSELFLRNVTMTVGTTAVPMISYGLYSYDATVSSSTLLTDSSYVGRALLPRKDFETEFVDRFNANLSNKTKLWDRLHTNHDSGTKLYISNLYDLQAVSGSLSGMVEIKHTFDMYSESEKINSLVGEFFLTNSTANGALSGFTQLTPNATFSAYEAGVEKQMTGVATVTWSNPNNYRYLQILTDVLVDDVVDFFDIALASPTLTIGGHIIQPISHFVPYSAKTGSYVAVAPLDGSLVTYAVLKTIVTESKWAGKVFVTYGDSITHYDGEPFNENHIEAGQIAKGYQSYMREKLGCVVVNRGSGGKTMPEIYGIINCATDLATFDAVTITSGANDHLQAVALGTLAAVGAIFNTNTFYGALQAAVEKVLTVKPSMKIYLITPVPGFFDDTTATYGNQNKISVDFVNAIKIVGELYGCPVLDWYHTVGINPLNKSVYLGDISSVPYDLHPTQALFARMGESAASFMENN
ncbi:SGNH/GDSL hydrolase family protein [Sporomusa malonica]|uniref:GDSL-like Lipase/Acylhydrolase family protein n=1 Tax=Sporomusa malonica TaxID=112901 RepID=A0A1W2AQZ9_9FIRM|nr:SGNH/GDSL hydrolase family protein [Sporomusa malonica]SMC63093.1 GDSL-like Lipase/Acylhydrolase family protein [Sporomusa malonica]